MATATFIIGLAIGGLAGALVALRLAARGRDGEAAVLGERLAAQEARHRDALDAAERRLADQAAHHAEALAAAERRVELVRGSREQLRDEMQAVSAGVLKPLGDQLTRELAAQRKADQERAEGELARRTAEIRAVVEPVAEKLGHVDRKVTELEKLRTASEGRLGEQLRALHAGVDTLARQAGNLTAALKRPATRGSWGEIQLRRAIEFAGLVDRCDFTEQTTVDTGDGKLRPDVLISLPGGKLVVVDAKVPLDAYLEALETEDDERREVELARHARQARAHVTKLAAKGYAAQFDTSPELVVMFVPSDGIWHAALAADPGLIEYGMQEGVLIATPTTLIGLLRAIHYGWKQELIAENAREIADTGRELHRRLATFAEPLAKLGRGLTTAVGAYNDAVGSFDRRVVPQLRRIEEAGAGSSRAVAAPPAVEEVARPVTAVLEPAALDDAVRASLDSGEPEAA